MFVMIRPPGRLLLNRVRVGLGAGAGVRENRVWLWVIGRWFVISSF